MIEAGIEHGCYVIFQPQEDVENGEIAVTRIDYPDETRSTVKKIEHPPNKIILKAENPMFLPQVQIFCRTDPTVHILGKALAVAKLRE